MLWISPLLLLLAFFAPGALAARRLRDPLWWASGLVFSLLLLFHSAFWLGVSHAPIALRTVLPILLGATAAAAWWARSTFVRRSGNPAAPWDLADRLLLGVCGVATAALVYRAATAPLLGFDTLFRWDFLARQILAVGNFNFYPPLTQADFHSYFYVDGIPPLVSFANWWTYAASGGHHPRLLSVFAGAQFAGTLAFVYGTAAELFSRKAGLLAAALLAACPLFFNAVVIEQETGLTALAISAMLYFLVRAKQPNDIEAMVSAGLAAALCALAREYGWIALIAGAATLAWRRFPSRQIAIFAAAAVAAAGPWYVREWLRTGNPFYSLAVGPFPVNPIHFGIMQFYRGVLHPDDTLVTMLATLAPLQLLAGVPGAAVRFRERGYLGATALLVTGVWLQSIGYTSAGLDTSLRVLTPAMAVLSIAAAGWLARWRGLAVPVVVFCLAWTIAQGSVYPGPFSTWPEEAFKRPLEPVEFQMAGELGRIMPKGSRILTDNAYLHAALLDKGIDVIPVWSPEVRFLFDSPGAEADRRIRELGIRTIAYYPTSQNTRYLARASKFYGELRRRWKPVADVSGIVVFYQPYLAAGSRCDRAASGTARWSPSRWPTARSTGRGRRGSRLRSRAGTWARGWRHTRSRRRPAS